MALSGIISVSGLPGLHKIISQAKNGLIVESLLDGRRRPIYSTQKVSSLEDISIYTYEEDLPLVEVFKKIKEKEGGKKSMDHKSNPADLRDHISSLVKDLDQDRVYNSDISKLYQWYNLLVEKDLLNLEDEEEETPEVKEEEKKEKAKPAPKKAAAKSEKAAAKKPAAKKTTSTAKKKSTDKS